MSTLKIIDWHSTESSYLTACLPIALICTHAIIIYVKGEFFISKNNIILKYNIIIIIKARVAIKIN